MYCQLPGYDVSVWPHHVLYLAPPGEPADALIWIHTVLCQRISGIAVEAEASGICCHLI